MRVQQEMGQNRVFIQRINSKVRRRREVFQVPIKIFKDVNHVSKTELTHNGKFFIIFMTYWQIIRFALNINQLRSAKRNLQKREELYYVDSCRKKNVTL